MSNWRKILSWGWGIPVGNTIDWRDVADGVLKPNQIWKPHNSGCVISIGEDGGKITGPFEGRGDTVTFPFYKLENACLHITTERPSEFYNPFYLSQDFFPMTLLSEE